MVLGIKAVFEKLGYSVYIDWINDRLLSREKVTKDTASVLQKRMRQSKSLIYVTSESSSHSKWMPWEAGFFDGIRDRMIAILPITDEEQSEKPFIGQEYLGLYPYLALDSLDKNFINKPMFMEPTAFESMLNQYRSSYKLFVFRDYQSYVLFENWINGEKPLSRLEIMNETLDKLNKLRNK
uniref:TIR domain-containing protein n=1 Tax=Hydrogenovibrio crunogenus (strain DSM 25203 / XCL-2) TaxID=317025 RepID=Q31IQ5_HYDCU